MPFGVVGGILGPPPATMQRRMRGRCIVADGGGIAVGLLVLGRYCTYFAAGGRCEWCVRCLGMGVRLVGVAVRVWVFAGV